LPLFVGLILVLFLDVLQESNLTDLVTIVVDDIAVVINLEASAVTKVTSSEATQNITVLVTDLTLLVDTHASHRVDATLLLLGLPALSLSDDIAVLVVDVAILIDLVASELLDITLNDATNDVASGCLDSTVLNDSCLVKASEWAFGSVVCAMDKLTTSNDVTFVVPDLALTIDLLAGEGSRITLSNATNDLATGVNDVAGLVDSGASKSGEVDFLLFLLGPWLSMTLNITILVDNVTVFIDCVTNKTLGVAFGKLANTVAVVVFDKSVLDHAESFESGERSLLALRALIRRNDVTATDNLASVAMNETIAVRLASSELGSISLDKLSDRNTFTVGKVTLLVQGETVENRKVGGLLILFLLKRLSVALDVAVLVKNVAILVNSHANKTLGVTLNNLANCVAILVGNHAALNDAETLKTSEDALRLALTLVLGDKLATANLLTLVVEDETLIVDLAACNFLGVTLDEASDWHTLISDNVALLVDSLAIKDGQVLRLLLFRSLLLGLVIALGVTDD
jgi:hypothetical protein